MASQKGFDVTMIPAEKINYQPDKDLSRFQQLGTPEYITSIKELATNIKAIGLLHPITVVKSGSDFVCVAGNRRLAALKEILDWPLIPCVIKGEDSFTLSFSEQIQRSDLTEIERGVWIDRAVENMKELPQFKESKRTTKDIMEYLSKIVGRSPRTLEEWRAMAKKFSPEEKARVAAGESAHGIRIQRQNVSTDKGGRPPAKGKGKEPKAPKVLTPEEKLAKEQGKEIKREATCFIKLSEKMRTSLAFISTHDLEYRQNKQVLASFKALQKALAIAGKLLDKKGSIVAIEHV